MEMAGVNIVGVRGNAITRDMGNLKMKSHAATVRVQDAVNGVEAEENVKAPRCQPSDTVLPFISSNNFLGQNN